MKTRTLADIPAARNTDPSTSHRAAYEAHASGRRQSQGEKFLAIVRAHPGLTSAEIGRLAGTDRYAPARRLPELMELGKVSQGLKRECSVMGSLAVTWYPKTPRPEQGALL